MFRSKSVTYPDANMNLNASVDSVNYTDCNNPRLPLLLEFQTAEEYQRKLRAPHFPPDEEGLALLRSGNAGMKQDKRSVYVTELAKRSALKLLEKLSQKHFNSSQVKEQITLVDIDAYVQQVLQVGERIIGHLLDAYFYANFHHYVHGPLVAFATFKAITYEVGVTYRLSDRTIQKIKDYQTMVTQSNPKLINILYENMLEETIAHALHMLRAFKFGEKLVPARNHVGDGSVSDRAKVVAGRRLLDVAKKEKLLIAKQMLIKDISFMESRIDRNLHEHAVALRTYIEAGGGPQSDTTGTNAGTHNSAFQRGRDANRSNANEDIDGVGERQGEQERQQAGREPEPENPELEAARKVFCKSRSWTLYEINYFNTEVLKKLKVLDRIDVDLDCLTKKFQKENEIGQVAPGDCFIMSSFPPDPIYLEDIRRNFDERSQPPARLRKWNSIKDVLKERIQQVTRDEYPQYAHVFTPAFLQKAYRYANDLLDSYFFFRMYHCFHEELIVYAVLVALANRDKCFLQVPVEAMERINEHRTRSSKQPHLAGLKSLDLFMQVKNDCFIYADKNSQYGLLEGCLESSAFDVIDRLKNKIDHKAMSTLRRQILLLIHQRLLNNLGDIVRMKLHITDEICSAMEELCDKADLKYTFDAPEETGSGPTDADTQEMDGGPPVDAASAGGSNKPPSSGGGQEPEQQPEAAPSDAAENNANRRSNRNLNRNNSTGEEQPQEDGPGKMIDDMMQQYADSFRALNNWEYEYLGYMCEVDCYLDKLDPIYLEEELRKKIKENIIMTWSSSNKSEVAPSEGTPSQGVGSDGQTGQAPDETQSNVYPYRGEVPSAASGGRRR